MAGKISIRYTTQMGSTHIQPLAGFRYDGFNQWIDVNKLRDNNVGQIKCIKCSGNDWTDNGRFMNEYECACCGAFISTEPKL